MPSSISVASLLTARRPSDSWASALPFDPSHSNPREFPISSARPSVENLNDSRSSSSPEDGGNFGRSLQIDMKGLVGDAVGNMSISPASRDVVLAARRGLFIIDLEAPLKIPRFLPQGGTWDVADVQWNPHPSRAEYIVSTSSEKLLIWNLFLVGKTSIEHILHSHYRAITDINWHTTEPDTVISVGIDSWLWAWDLREPRKPIFGLSAFTTGGTQVKWSRQDANMLASSHLNRVLIWDRRKGSLPISQIAAHSSKIYGIDWSHSRGTEIVTCSLDRTIKVWDTQLSDSTPQTTIQTRYPVWRARDLPFGRGVLSLPQRGETVLEMWAHDKPQAPVESFEGHADVVKEFVWRKGGQNSAEFQLITWSKDRTLRFWPVDFDMMEKVGDVSVSNGGLHHTVDKMGYLNVSFRDPPKGSSYPPALSAPTGHRSILAEVRAPYPLRPDPVMQPHYGSDARENTFHAIHQDGTEGDTESLYPSLMPTTPLSLRRGGTMSRGNVAGSKSAARMDAFTWLSNVKVGEKRGESSSGPGSGANSVSASRLNSRSRPPLGQEKSVRNQRRRSDSRSKGGDGDISQSLQDEITSVLTKLASSKISLEKHDLTKKRSCTFGLHGPWGESSSVFLRISFTFPREYPHSAHPDGTPTIELERNPLISIQDRASILRRLRRIREGCRPCLEACLRFLLFGNEDERTAITPTILHSDSSSDEDKKPLSRISKDFTVSLLRNTKNLAEPRTSQGVFGPNGAFVYFFRAPPRLVGSTQNHTKPKNPDTVPRRIQPPALVSEAVQHLNLSALDRAVRDTNVGKFEDDVDNGADVLRVMSNLLTFSRQQLPNNSGLQSVRESTSNYTFLSARPIRRSTVFINNVPNITGGDKTVATRYIFEGGSLREVCEHNALVAKECGRQDHERVFRILCTLFPISRKRSIGSPFNAHPLVLRVVIQLYSKLSDTKDVQMLAMVSAILLQANNILSDTQKTPRMLLNAVSQKFDLSDYFSLTRRKGRGRADPLSVSSRLPSSITAPLAPPSISSSNSSRGSWSSLFNTGGMRQFMTGVQETFKEGFSPLPDQPQNNSMHNSTITFGDSILSPTILRRPQGSSSPCPQVPSRGSTPQFPNAISKSLSDLSLTSVKPNSMFSSLEHRRATFSQNISSELVIPERHVLVFEEPDQKSNGPMFEKDLLDQFISHVSVYGEILFGWRLFHKRVELLKSVKNMTCALPNSNSAEFELGLMQICSPYNDNSYEARDLCKPFNMPQCSFCGLSVYGLSQTCLQCLHIIHLSCWRSLEYQMCLTGCGCHCIKLNSVQASTG